MNTVAENVAPIAPVVAKPVVPAGPATPSIDAQNAGVERLAAQVLGGAAPDGAEPSAPSDTIAHHGGEFLSFRLGAEEYGIEILKVQEIRSYNPPTRIANAPPYIKGVVNLRGVIVPIIDLRLKLALEHAEYNEFTVVIVLSVAHRVVGVVVDSVRDVLRLEPSQIRPAPDFNSAVDEAFIVGIGTLTEKSAHAGEESNASERMLILIDIERLIAASDIGFDATTVH